MSVAVRRALKLSGWTLVLGLSATLLAAVVDNLAPVFDSTPYPVAEVGQTYRYDVHATDPDGNDVAYSLEQGPAGMAYSESEQAVGWTPAADQTGLTQVAVRARDSWGASAEQSYTLRTVADYCEIYPITIPQQLLVDAASGDQLDQIARGTGAGNFSWLTWGGDTNAPTLATSLLPPGDSYNYVSPDSGADHLLEVADWAQGATGSMNADAVRSNLDALKTQDIIIPTWSTVRGQGSKFDYRVAKFAVVRLKDYQLTGQGWLSFEFRGYKDCYNDAPVAANQTLTTPEDQPLPVQLSAVDPENDVLTYQVVQGPAHGHLEGAAPALSYVPDANYNGPDAFTFRANDAEFASNIATVLITVTPVNDPPTANSQAIQTDEDTPVSITLTGADIDGDSLQFQIRQTTAHGELVGSGANWEYQPAHNFFGVDQFTFVSNDGELASADAIVTITVIEKNAAPSAQDRQYQVKTGVPLDVLLAGTDPDGDALNFRLLSTPGHGELSGTAPDLSFVSDAGYTGTVSFTYVSNDGRLDSAPATVTIEVIGANHAPSITSIPTNFVDERSTYGYDIDALDPDVGDVLAYSLDRTAAGASVDRPSGQFAWNADPAAVGSVRASNKACRKVLESGALDPVVQWEWTESAQFPLLNQIMSPPLVAQMTDDNGDGKVDQQDNVDVVVLTHKGWDNGFDGTLKIAVVRILDGRSGQELRVINPLPTIDGFTNLALADIDGDGEVDIIGADVDSGVTVMHADGSVLWRRGGLDGRVPYARTPTIADLDGDGKPEVIVGTYVLSNTGHVRWRMRLDAYGKNAAFYSGVVSVADLDGDGKQEVIAGGAAYNSDGILLWRNPNVADGYSAVGDVVSDSRPEIVVVHIGRLYVVDSTGALLWSVPLPGGGEGGAPTLADMDGDGELEIGVAAASRYTAFNADGSILWSSPTQDLTSRSTGSTVFDLEGDGEAEVLYNDEQSLRIYRGRDGKVLFEVRSTTGTQMEYPTVANIDDDPGAEILVGSNEFMQFTGRDSVPGTHGLRVFASASQSWAPTRAIWNQHAYSINNINDDGTVPRQPEKSWLTHNTFRLNTFADRNPVGMADLAIFDLRLDPLAPGTLRMTVVNRGLAPTAAVSVVHVHDGANAEGRLLGTLKLPVLAAGEARELSLANIDTDALGDSVYAVVDDVDTVAECLENNNTVQARVFHGRATDQGGLFDRQAFTVGVLDVNDAPVFQNDTPPTPHIGQKFRHVVKAVDPDIGDGLLYRLDSSPAGMTIEAVSGEIRWTPTAAQAGTPTIVVRVTDLRGLSATQTVPVTLAANRAPVIDSTPVRDAIATTEYRYELDASDPDGDVLTYLLTSAPDGMEINGYNGAVTWTPPLEQGGSFNVTVKVMDANGGVVTQSYTVTVTLPQNHAPEFTSTPVTANALGQRYQYDSLASDTDGDVLNFMLTEAPLGMAVDTVTGVIVWQPRTDQVGAHTVVLQVSDPRGGTDTQEFTVLVSAGVDSGNHPPSVSSIPETAALIDQAYVYALVASDLDGDALSYTLQTAPSGMTIDASTGAVTWTPTSTQAGLNPVSIVVSDGRGGTATHSFSILASTVPAGGTGNRPPSITSDPLTLVTLGQTYRYYLIAVDADGDTLTYQLAEAPPGMTIDPSTGVLAWTPSALGPVSVSVRVDDGRGGASMQSFAVTTVDTDTSIDHRPVVLEPPFGDAKLGLPYDLTLQAVDADGDAMTFTLVSGPDGATVDAVTGQVAWTPDAVGTASFTVRISSGDGYTEITWTVQVVAAETPLSVHVVVTPERVAPGAAITIAVEFDGASGPVTLQASLNNNAVVLDADGATSLVAPTTPGFYQLVVTVDDGNAIATDAADFFIADPSDAMPPTVAISTPAIDGRVTAPTSVTGQVLGDDVARWTLSLIDKSNGVMTAIAQGSQASGPGVLGQLDPTLLSNGFYTLVLQAWDAGGNQAQDSRSVLVDGDMKLGHYSVSFEDVSIPMAGFPLRVTRTYDTRRRKERLDFGYGWSVDYQNLRLTESRAPGYSWTLVSEREGYFGNWCVRPNGDPIVAITGPDGELMKFRAKALPECQFLVPQTDVQLVFEPLPGTDAQLDQTDYQNLRLASVAGSGVYNLLDLSDPYQAAANPSHYRLKLPDGTVYSVTQGVGISKIAEPDGNTLTFTRDGVKHSLGQEVRFFRDGQGRIEEVVLPDGARRRYTYTPGGDLEMAVDTGGDIVSFGYLAQAPHYLRDIVDPRGVRVSRNEYDDDGRLVATIDADGHRIQYTHNLAGRTEIIRDRRGNASIYAYDAEGRVTGESNALGETMLHSYDSNGNELSTTDPLGHVTVRTFDPRGNVLTETDATGHKTRHTYNERNNELTQTDALDRVVVTNGYNAYTGRLVMTQNALGELTSFGFDSGIGSGGTGELIGITDAANQQTRYKINFFGHRYREIDALGNFTSFNLDTQGRVHGQSRRRTRADGTVETLATLHTLDAKDRIVATVHPDGSRTTVEYDGNDKPTTTCDGLNRCTLQQYDARGQLAKTSYPDGTFETTGYDENGNVTAQTDRGGRTTKMRYDAANRLVETILPDATPGDDSDNPRTENQYDAAGRLTASINERNVRTEYGYDDAGRRTTVTDALHRVTTTTYNAIGQREAVTDALGRTTRFVYDAAGRLTDTIHPDDTAFEDDNPRTSVTYDAVGRKTLETDELGRQKAYQYDALGRMVAVSLPNPATGRLDDGKLVTRFVYDEVGNKTQQIDALGRITRWEYDAMGRQTRRTLPGGQTETSRYDAAGQLIARTDFNGRITGYSYDAVGRLEGIDYETDPDVITTYTASGQRESATDGQGTTVYAYDARDRLTRVANPDGQVLTYGYDAAGNRTELHSAALDQTFDYDPLNRLSAVHSQTLGGAVRTVGYTYDEVGNRKTLTQANGTTTTTSFDARNRLRQLLTRSAAGVLLFGATYDVDDSGARTGIGEFNAQGQTRSVGYAYDGAKRLLAEVIERPGQPARVANYVYDAVGNRLSKTEAGAETTYTVDDNDRLIEERTGGVGTLYTYDANGNTTGQAKAGEVVTYGYDEANRRVRTTTTSGVVTTGYSADGVRNREIGNGHARAWLIDPNRDYAQTLEAYTDQQLSTVWMYGDELVAQSNVIAGGLHERNLHSDGMGSVRQASDAGGSVTDSFEYDAFGNQLGRTGTTDIDHRYRGEQVDPNTGFYNLRARWYDPNSGRFTSTDAFAGRSSDPTSLHKYLYASSDPVNSWDPSGYMTIGEIGTALRVNVQSVLTAQSNRAIGMLANRSAGKALEAYVRAIIEREFAGAEFYKIRALTGPGGKRVYDILVKIGDRLINIEVKTNLPMGGQAFARLLGQIRTFRAPNEAFAQGAELIIFAEGATEAAAGRLAIALGVDNPPIVSTALELITVIRGLLIGI
ncbi:MAG: Ig-like domain-containing protein [Arenimonas sp.]|jgi:RHS repeat-associated protein